MHTSNTPPLAWLQREHSRAFVLATLVVIGLFCVTITLVARRAPKPLGTLCLTPADYSALTGKQTDGSLSPRDNFYTTTVLFEDNTSEYSASSAAKEDLRKLGTFFRAHPQKSMLFIVSSDYSQDRDVTVAADRTARVSKDLMSRGVSKEAISRDTPRKVDDPEGNTISFTTVVAYTMAGCK